MAAAIFVAARAKNKMAEAAAADESSVEEQAKLDAAKMARMKRIVQELDQDGDGMITREELLAWKSDDGAVRWLPYRKKVKRFYQAMPVQLVVSSVILVSFLANILQKELDPYPSEYQKYRATWEAIDEVSTYFFIVELLVNLYGSFLKPFLRDGWNWLDMTVVVVGIISIANIEGASQLKIVRIVRTFRVLRLFRRLTSLRKIITALVFAIPGVLNALLIMLIFMSIYAIVAVDLFRPFGASGEYETIQAYGIADAQYGESCGPDAIECESGSRLGGFFENHTSVTSVTMRGVYYGQEYYGTFSRALYTLFQVMTGESWSEAVARPLLISASTAAEGFGVGAFFVTFILLTQVVLINVVVAVLIEKFTVDYEANEAEVPMALPQSRPPPAPTASCSSLLSSPVLVRAHRPSRRNSRSSSTS
mmetsp:Transcript_24825/g.49808  ORF Transcript_24825/g.49808 Transcript_24825/m.49808 type:complete len:422 (-) Transcript_24825:2536-3801(-)